MFDAGAIVGRIILDKSDFDSAIKGVQGKIASLGQGMTSLGNNLSRVSRQLGQVGRNLAFFGAGIVTPLILAFKNAQDYSTAVRGEVERLSNAFLRFRITIAEALVPVMHQLSNILADLVGRWDKLSPAMRESILRTTFMVGTIMLLSGTFISLASKIGTVVGALSRLAGGILTFGAAHIPLTLTVLALAGIAIAITKIWGLNNVLNWFEKIALKIAEAWIFCQKSLLGVLNVLIKINDPFGLWSKGIQNFIKLTEDGLGNALEVVQDKLKDLAEGKGMTVAFVDDIKEKIGDLKNFLADLGKTEIEVPIIRAAADSFAKGWRDGIGDAIAALKDWGKTARSIVEQTVSTMQSLFSNLFQNVLKGQLKNAKDFFVDFGNFVLKIISDIIAQWVTMKIITGIFGGVSNMAGAGGGVGAVGGVAGMGTGFTTNFGTGHQEGIERVPHTGIFKLHQGEQVVPRYDATKGSERIINLEIVNAITPEAIAAAMMGREGQGVVINIVNGNSLRNGVIRREVKTR